MSNNILDEIEFQNTPKDYLEEIYKLRQEIAELKAQNLEAYSALDDVNIKLNEEILQLKKQFQVTNSGWPHEKELHRTIADLTDSLKLAHEVNEKNMLSLMFITDERNKQDDIICKLKSSLKSAVESLEYAGNQVTWWGSTKCGKAVLHTYGLHVEMCQRKVAELKAKHPDIFKVDI